MTKKNTIITTPAEALASAQRQADEAAATTGATHYVKDITPCNQWITDGGLPLYIVLHWHDAVDLHGIQKGRIIYTASPEDAA